MKKYLSDIWNSLFHARMVVTYQAKTFDQKTTVGRVIHYSKGMFNDSVFENEVKKLVQTQLGKSVVKLDILQGQEF